MSESLAVVCVVGLVLGSVSVTAFGLVTILQNKTLQFRAGKTGLELSVDRPIEIGDTVEEKPSGSGAPGIPIVVRSTHPMSAAVPRFQPESTAKRILYICIKEFLTFSEESGPCSLIRVSCCNGILGHVLSSSAELVTVGKNDG